MKNLITYSFLAFLLILFSSCEDWFETTADLDVPIPESKIVVNSILNDDRPFIATISHSIPVLDERYIYNGETRITNATVEVFEGEEFLTALEFYEVLNVANAYYGDNLYAAPDFSPEIGKEYTIKVSAPGYESVQAVGLIPNPVEIDDIELTDIDYLSLAGEGDYSEYTLSFTDEPSVENYYYIRVFECDQYDNCNSWCLFSLDAVFGASNDDPFAGSEIDCKRGIDSYFRDLTFSDLEKKLEFFVDRNLVNQINSGKNIELFLGTISKDFYLYSRSVDFQGSNRDNPFAEPVQVYSNVENGYGFFGGASQSRIALPGE